MTFWELLKQSVLVQATVTLIVVSGLVYMYVTGQPVPSELVNIVMLILGFYFGGKVTAAGMRQGGKDADVTS